MPSRARSYAPVGPRTRTGTECPPEAWWQALQEATTGLLDDVAAIGVGGQQHGMVGLDEAGEVIRPAILWNDTRSAPDAEDLIAELGGAEAWAAAVGLVPVASFTVTKLRWLARAGAGQRQSYDAACCSRTTGSPGASPAGTS